MTVAELIKLLKEQPQDAEAVFDDRIYASIYKVHYFEDEHKVVIDVS